MLAEVASATLKSDPSLNSNGSRQRFRKNSKSRLTINNCSKKSMNGSEKLTLDQIKVLSDKMLIEMFSELTSDEIRRNYSFKCFLIPDKCSQIFKSFGNETRARCKMKAHLLSHIHDLISEANGKNCYDRFTAEPLYVRRRRLKEFNSRSTRKKKRSKKQGSNRRKDSAFDRFTKYHQDLRNHKSRKAAHSVNKKLKNNCSLVSKIRKKKCSSGIEKCTSTNTSDSEIKDSSGELLPMHSDLMHSSTNVSLHLPDLANNMTELTCDLPHLSNQIRSKSEWKNEAEVKADCISVQSDYASQWRVNYGIAFDDAISTERNYHSVSEQFIPSHHDHTYTSVYGKTFNCDLPLTLENSKGINKVIKELKKPYRNCPTIVSPLVIPTPPFPYVYIPLLPHIAEIKEIGNSTKTSCDTYIDDDFVNDFHENNINSDNMPLLHLNEEEEEMQSCFFNRLISPEINDPESNDDEISPSEGFMDDVSEDGNQSEANDSKLSDASYCMDDLLKTECPENLQAVEKKLALKFIRALRTKKKDERGPLVCQICKNKSFTAQATLMYHYRSHAGIKPFSCTVCEATFTRQHSLNYHMLIHNNKSRFVCGDCGRNFRHPSHYKEHLRRHTGETPYECTDCNLRFKTRNTYKRHLKTRHGKILTAQGIRLLSVEEFCKVRTSPRKRPSKSESNHKRDQETQWPEIMYPESDFYF
ncbi:uncharacterized protein LOC118197632 [Stegodyphus dumicola]|uniref:uncharacterized protein LOC118197632 n=1 Tax=Stegodyphus dumicola TaxID=202533 RepID=UPI0015A97BEE|nr:uncharacterized protein LOC118197632 [Stegodyphus dumicola]